MGSSSPSPPPSRLWGGGHGWLILNSPLLASLSVCLLLGEKVSRLNKLPAHVKASATAQM